MTISDAIANAKAMTGAAVDDTTLLRWLSELDGKIAFDVYGADSWLPYTNDDLSSELEVSYPWDEFYIHYLEAMTYYSRGETDRYMDAKAMFDYKFLEFKKYLRRTHPELRPCCTEGMLCLTV